MYLVWIDVMRGLKKIYLRSFKEKGKVVLLGDFNARVGRSVQIYDIIDIIEEDTCNANGNRFLSFLNEVKLMVCNGRKLV